MKKTGRISLILALALILALGGCQVAFAAQDQVSNEDRSITVQILYVDSDGKSWGNLGPSWTLNYTCGDSAPHSATAYISHGLPISDIIAQKSVAQGKIDSSECSITGWFTANTYPYGKQVVNDGNGYSFPYSSYNRAPQSVWSDSILYIVARAKAAPTATPYAHCGTHC